MNTMCTKSKVIIAESYLVDRNKVEVEKFTKLNDGSEPIL